VNAEWGWGSGGRQVERGSCGWPGAGWGCVVRGLVSFGSKQQPAAETRPLATPRTQPQPNPTPNPNPNPQKQGNKKLEVGIKAKNRFLLRDAIELYGKGLELKSSEQEVNVALLNNRSHVQALLGARSSGGRWVLAAS